MYHFMCRLYTEWGLNSLNNSIFWYKYRDNLYKKVTVFGSGEAQCSRIVHKFKKMQENSESDIQCDTVTPEEVELSAYGGRAAGNVRRASCSIEELSLCNSWDFFITLTLSPKLVRDRLDLDAWHKGLSRWLYDLGRRVYHSHISYVLVPELHKSRTGWHMHGLVSGLPKEALRLFTLDEHLPVYIRKKLKSGELVYDWPAYRDKYGFCDIEPILSPDACSRYVSKYITKGSLSTANDVCKGRHLYYCSRGLLRRTLLEGYECVSGDTLLLQYRLEPIKKENDVVSLDLSSPYSIVSLVHDATNSYKYDYGCVDWYTACKPANATY